MYCGEINYGADREFLDGWARRALVESVPITGSFALTHGCNLRCVHCYAGPGLAEDSIAATEEWLGLVDEVAAAGCLFLLLTGGEPMLHPGFAQIYRAAKEAGMYVTVFSNGTLLDDEILELFDELPPLAVEISLYGACSATHDGVTGVDGSFDRTVKAIEQLLEHRVNLRVKSMLMTPTEAEFDEIRQLVEEHYGLEFRMDAALIARLDGDCSPLDLRVEPAVAVEHEMRCRGALERWRKLLKKRDDSGYHACVLGKRLYRCGAGAIGFHIDAGMRILPCLMTSWLGCGLQAGDFAGGWQKIVEVVRGQEAPAGLKCVACDDDILCGWCPAYVEQELGDTGASSSFLCELAGYRREAVCSSCD